MAPNRPAPGNANVCRCSQSAVPLPCSSEKGRQWRFYPLSSAGSNFIGVLATKGNAFYETLKLSLRRAWGRIKGLGLFQFSPIASSVICGLWRVMTLPMRKVVFEIREEDVYASIKPGLRVPEVPPPSRAPEARPEPMPELPVAAGSSAVSYDELARLAEQPKNAQIKVTGATPVALACFRGANNPCVMCLQPLMRICHRCQCRESSYRECSILKGTCGHLVHKHCLGAFQNAHLCLTCRRPWVVSREVPLVPRAA